MTHNTLPPPSSDTLHAGYGQVSSGPDAGGIAAGYGIPAPAPSPFPSGQDGQVLVPYRDDSTLGLSVPAYNTVGAPEYRGKTFVFDGGAGSFFLVGLGCILLYVFTLGLAAPWCMAMYYRWKTNHTIVNGRRLAFTGTGGSLFGHYLKWWLLTIVTFGIYSFWVWPRMVRWATEKQEIGAAA